MSLYAYGHIERALEKLHALTQPGPFSSDTVKGILVEIKRELDTARAEHERASNESHKANNALAHARSALRALARLHEVPVDEFSAKSINTMLDVLRRRPRDRREMHSALMRAANILHDEVTAMRLDRAEGLAVLDDSSPRDEWVDQLERASNVVIARYCYAAAMTAWEADTVIRGKS